MFGELALLYNCKRAATIVAKTDCELWKLDRDTFNHIVKDSARKQRERYELFLNKVKLLDKLNSYEKSILCDAFRERNYEKGETIIKEGEEGDLFYLVESGSAKATKVIDGVEKEVMQYAPGDYFGERALLTKQARAATVIAIEDCVLAEMDESTFSRLMGPLEEIMKDRMEAYEGENS